MTKRFIYYHINKYIFMKNIFFLLNYFAHIINSFQDLLMIHVIG